MESGNAGRGKEECRKWKGVMQEVERGMQDVGNAGRGKRVMDRNMINSLSERIDVVCLFD